MGEVFETLNRLKWTGRLERSAIAFVHRGAPGDIKVISGRQVTEIKRGHLCYSAGGGETFIPLHRLREIALDGEPLWKKSTGKG